MKKNFRAGIQITPGCFGIFPTINGHIAISTLNQLKKIAKFSLLTLIISYIPVTTVESATRRQLLDDMQVVNLNGEPAIRITFNQRMRYVQHTPKTSGRTLQIRVQPIIGKLQESILPHRETIPVTATSAVPLKDFTFDVFLGRDSVLTLKFQHNVAFRVEPGKDFRSILVHVQDATSAAVPAASSVAAAATAQESATPAGQPAALTKEEKAALAMLKKGKEALIAQDYPTAIEQFFNVLRSPATRYHREALELLGIARERSGELDLARLTYEKYLSLYPKGEASERVRQRLAAILTMTKPIEKTGPVATAEKKKGQWDFYGGFSQFFFRDSTVSDSQGERVNQSQLLHDLDLTSRYRDDRYQLRAQFDGRYRNSFQRNFSATKWKINNLFVEGSDNKTGLSARIGRQTTSTGGVLGRFDGAVIGWRFHPKWQFLAVGGFPFESFADNNVNTNKNLYGFTMEWGPFYDYWAGNVFFINQEADNLLDRRAVGTEIRYQHPKLPFVVLVDYDIHFASLNLAQLVGNWFLDNGATFTYRFDYRKQPLLTTSNALIRQPSGLPGQPFDNLHDLHKLVSRNDLQDLAQSNSFETKQMYFDLSWPFTENFRASGTFSLTNTSNLKPLKGQPSLRSSSLAFTYAAQFIYTNLFMPGDVNLLRLQFMDNDNANVYALTVDNRYPITPSIRLDPRLLINYIADVNDQPDELRIRPAFRFTFSVFDQFHQLAEKVSPVDQLVFEVETGFEWSNLPRYEQDSETWGYYITAGYRIGF